MKKLVILFAVLMVSVSAFAGPLIGVGIIPAVGMPAVFTAGWDFGSMNIEVLKADLSSFYGDWWIGALWTPAANGFDYRAGVKVLLNWSVPVVYNGFGVAIGVSRTWGPFQAYADLNIFPTGVFLAYPIIGLNFLFDALGGTVNTGE